MKLLFWAGHGGTLSRGIFIHTHTHTHHTQSKYKIKKKNPKPKNKNQTPNLVLLNLKGHFTVQSNFKSREYRGQSRCFEK